MKIFGNRHDKLLIQFPNFLLLLAIFHIALVHFFKFPLGHISPLKIFIVESLFFGAFHAPMTFVLLCTLPEFKLWAKNSRSSGPFSFWVNCILVYIFCAGILYLGGGLFQNHSTSFLLFIIAISFRNILRINHNIGQATGVSILINQKYRAENPESDLKKINKLRFSEGLLTNLLIVFFSLYSMFNILTDSENKALLVKIFFWLLISLCLAFLVVALYHPKKIRSLKFQFCLRHMLCPLQILTPIAFGTRVINHGIENFLIVNKILSNSQNNHKKIFFRAAIIVAIVWILWCLPRELGIHDLYGNNVRLFFSLLWALDLTHFWAERVIYRMRDNYTRETIGSLLV